jgi:hypothetical protein
MGSVFYHGSRRGTACGYLKMASARFGAPAARRRGEGVIDELAEVTYSLRNPARPVMRQREQGPSPLPWPSATATRRGKLVTVMQPADLA